MADTRTAAKLIFPPGYKLDGFESSLTSGQAGEADPVVRELLQNCLDAALREGGRDCAVVHFTIAEHPIGALPGLKEYQRAFRAGRTERQQRPVGITNDERAAIGRIADVLERETVPVLFCRDNGVGLDREGLQSLLSEGNSNKPSGGAGSKGVGHLTAYAASDLRYVLYAGRRPEGDIATGHAVLAAHKIGSQRRDPDGYWQLESDLTNFSLENGLYPDRAPSLLQRELQLIDDRGSVVAITGFNNFDNGDRASAVADIARVTAVNFMAAIWERRMTVEIHDQPGNSRELIERDSLEKLLWEDRDRRRAKISGWLAGNQAYRALQVLKRGDELAEAGDPSLRVFFRPSDTSANEPSRVQVFRDGMWITNDALHLRPSDFRSCKPFDAVVLLQDTDIDNHDEFYDLVRDAEGPEHRDLKKLRKMPLARQRLLRSKLASLADRLRAEAGELANDDGFTPQGFAVFDGDVERVAKPIPSLRPTSRGAYRATGRGGRGGRGSGQRGGGGQGAAARERDTSIAVDYRYSVRAHVGDDGSARALDVELQLNEQLPPEDALLLDVLRASGSDASCDQPIGWRRLNVATVTINGKALVSARGEIQLPHDTRILRVELAQAAANPDQVQIGLRRRRPDKDKSA